MMTNGSYGNSLNDISTFGGSMSQITCIISFSTLVFLKLQSWCHHIDTLQQSYVAYAPRCVIDNSGWYNIRRLEYSFSAPQYLLNWERCSPNSICWGGWLSTFTSRSNFLSPLDREKLITIRQVLVYMLDSSVVLTDNQYWTCCSEMHGVIQRS